MEMKVFKTYSDLFHWFLKYNINATKKRRIKIERDRINGDGKVYDSVLKALHCHD